MAIERTFQDIPSEDISKADQQSYLSTLARIRDTEWHDLLRSKRILIISEAGAGKTYECKKQQEALWEKGEPAFFLELSVLAKNKLREMLFGEQETRLNTWITSQSDIATFFLDSIDELNISQGSFKQALVSLRKGIDEQLSRARIIITTRPTAFDIDLVHEILEIPKQEQVVVTGETFARIAMHGNANRQGREKENQIPHEFRTVALLPLSDDQIIDFAYDKKVDNPHELLDALKKNNAQEFARRPQDLIELCEDWRSSKRIRKHEEQVLNNILIKSKPRNNRLERLALSTDKAIDGASRIALAMLVTRRLTIRYDSEKDTISDDLALDPALILTDWNPEEIKVLLERPLFGFANYGRVRFHHRSVAEYLAAKRLLDLRKKGMTTRVLQQLIFAETKDNIIVRPSKRSVAGWLALKESMVFEMLRDHEPSVLLSEGDPESLTIFQRAEALRAYVERYGNGGYRGLEIPEIQIHRFASTELAFEINNLWNSGIANPEIRELLLDIIGTGRITECSDIAHDSSQNKSSANGERLHALNALVKLDDPRLVSVAAEIADNANTLPDTMARRTPFLLFPKYLAATQFCKILARIKVKSIDSIGWQLTDLITKADLNLFSLNELRDRLYDLITEGLRWQDDRPHFISNNSKLCSALAAACIRGLKNGPVVDWLRPSALVLRLCDPNTEHDDVFKKLSQMLAELPAKYQELLFWTEDALLQSLHSIDDPWDRFYEVAIDGSLTLDLFRDVDWIKKMLSDTSRLPADRALFLEAALWLGLRQEKKFDHIIGLKSLVVDKPELLTRIEDRYKKLIKQDQEHRCEEIQDAKRKKKQERKEKKAFASWVVLWRELTEDCVTAFSAEKSENTAWNLWRVMNQVGNDNWNRRFIETQFDKETADFLRLTLMKQWRNDLPTLPSERPVELRGTTLVRWRQGLAGLYAEAEDPQWAMKLSEEEAKLAARYALLELNGFPLWLDILAQVHPTALDATLGEELSREMNCPADAQWQSMLLQNISYASTTINKAFLPRLWNWFIAKNITSKDEDSRGEIRRLNMVVETLVKHGDEDMLHQIHTIAKKNLRKKIPFSIAAIWLPVLMQLNVRGGVDVLEKRLNKLIPAQYSEAVTWFSILFGERNNGLNLNDSQFTPDLLLRLLRLSYLHVRPADDIQHDGVFHPDSRDNAERVRNAILMALLNSKGEKAWLAKMEIVADPLFDNLKERIQAIAEERWAEEIDTDMYDNEQAVALDTKYEAPPSTNEAMFNVMVGRLEDISLLLASDGSPRELWARIDEEKLMRREIARELENKANGMFKANQEAVTGDEKETDIRLYSKHSNHEAVIELKLADKEYSARTLRNTLKNQLVKKYMAPENRRSGCLLITLAKEKKWKHPDNNSYIDFNTLIHLLNKEAQRIMNNIGGLRIHVHALDLRPRLPTEKRLKKEKK
ncbi:MAG: ATP-binding protein [Chlorobiaceae bacterium]|nr:ATP-binding protein [Chlorobiaceae bacterium]